MVTPNNNMPGGIRDLAYHRNNGNDDTGKMKINTNAQQHNPVNSNMCNISNSMNNNNYSLGLYIDNPQDAFTFDENDLKTLFSHYKGARNIRILSDKAAAQITFNDRNMIQQVRKDMNGLTITDIGTIRCIILNEGKTVEQFLPFSANDPASAKQKQCSNQSGDDPVNMLKKLANLLQPGRAQGSNTAPKISASSGSDATVSVNMGGSIATNVNVGGSMTTNANVSGNPMPGKNQVKNKISNQPIYNNGGSHLNQIQMNEGEHSENNPYATKRLSRIELIDIFGFPVEFDVMKKILGKNESNISYIKEQTNNSVSIEIKGKPFNEAPIVERMHVSVSSDDLIGYKKATELIVKLLNSIFEEFYDFCYERDYPVPENLSFKRHEYMYNADGSTKYVGFKDKWHVMKDSHRTDYSFRKNRGLQEHDKDKRMHGGVFGGHSNLSIHYGNQNAPQGDFKNYRESNQGDFRNMKLNRAPDQHL
ncbi:hypothetical protein C922_03986 [Plasmodium inui San Antonio 1]|uniref:KHDC4/BBP-like KH-domain type I domain-containing protein n=1 Tax=Plasmodium inui San Antonio 1 TaxID=1237626 RepID=W7A318_9APIC|nr:hypothetical protein C922_03986 [Plasmodium inui San Antonio 1]EUD65738.1 hypothetical protein C922_03986 [Plasmodium inui San Antonio 1]